MKVIMVSRVFPKKHPKAGQPTYFVEKILKMFWDYGSWKFDNNTITFTDHTSGFVKISNSDGFTNKWHTIRAGERWKEGEMASLRYWSDKPYCSKQVEFAQVELKKIWDFTINGSCFSVNGDKYFGETEADFELLERIAANDGLDRHDLVAWVRQPNNKTFGGQIICWSDKINY